MNDVERLQQVVPLALHPDERLHVIGLFLFQLYLKQFSIFMSLISFHIFLE